MGGEFIAARLPEVGQQLLERESVLTQGHAKVALVSEVVRWRIDSAVIQLSCLRMFQWQCACACTCLCVAQVHVAHLRHLHRPLRAPS